MDIINWKQINSIKHKNRTIACPGPLSGSNPISFIKSLNFLRIIISITSNIFPIPNLCLKLRILRMNAGAILPQHINDSYISTSHSNAIFGIQFTIQIQLGQNTKVHFYSMCRVVTRHCNHKDVEYVFAWTLDQSTSCRRSNMKRNAIRSAKLH